MSATHDEGTGMGPVIWVIVICMAGVLALVALFTPADTTNLFLQINERVNDFFNSPIFTIAKFIAGILTVGLASLATWLFFRLLEIEKEHEEHAYHHASHQTEHHHENEPHTETPHPVISEEQVYPESTPLPVVHAEEVHDSPVSTAQTKTAPPPARLPGESGVRGAQVGEEHPGHFQWQSVLRLATSINPSDWKLAIIEADVILDMMTYMQGFPGQTLGERLQNADIGSFQTLKYAKQAHYMRNQIAHQSDLELTPRDVNQTIRMYETVFNEFKYI